MRKKIVSAEMLGAIRFWMGILAVASLFCACTSDADVGEDEQTDGGAEPGGGDDAGGAIDGGDPEAGPGGGDANGVLDGGEKDAALDGGDPDAGQEMPWPEITVSDTAYLILYDDALGAAAESLGAYREGTEASVDLLSMSAVTEANGAGDSSEAIETAIRDWAEQLEATQPKSVLLLGDAEAIPPRELAGRSSTVGPSITTDNPYADLDDDGIPDMAMGRIPVQTEAEAELMVDKIMTHESVYEPGPWNKRINIVASEAGFGAVIDQAIEDIALQIIDPLDNAYDITMTYGSQSSEFVYPPEKLSDQVYERMNEGSLLMAYLGHGYESGFLPMTWSGDSYPIFDTDQLDNLQVRHRVPFLAFIACSNAAFDGAEDTVSERILKQPDAPAVIFASTEVSHPYANTVLVREVALNLLESEPRHETVGELFLRAKQTTISNLDAMRLTIDVLAVAFVGDDDPALLLEEALHMYVLLGDPAMRLLQPPHRAAVQTDKTVYGSGETVSVSVDTTGIPRGEALVTLESTRGEMLKPILPVPADDDPTRDDVIEQNYQNANDKVIDSQELEFTGGSVSADFLLGRDLPALSTYYIKVLALGTSRDAIGVAEFALMP